LPYIQVNNEKKPVSMSKEGQDILSH